MRFLVTAPSLEYALGRDVPRGNSVCTFAAWFKHANAVTSAADSGSHIGPQVGLHSDE